MNYWNPLMEQKYRKNHFLQNSQNNSFFEEIIYVIIAKDLIVFLTQKLVELFAPIVEGLMMKFLIVQMNGGAPIMMIPGKRIKAVLECQLMNIL
jgi:hypothetical protein